MIIEAIDQYLKSRPRKWRKDRCFHPSALHLPAKALYDHYMGRDGERELDPRTLRIFDNGSTVHERIQGYLKDAGLLVQAEVPVKNEQYEIFGHADGIVRLNGVEGVLELKSINAFGFHNLYEPKADHVVQVNTYMFCLAMPRAVLVYECKDDQELKEFFLKRDDTILQPILAKIRLVQSWVRHGGIEE